MAGDVQFAGGNGRLTRSGKSMFFFPAARERCFLDTIYLLGILTPSTGPTCTKLVYFLKEVFDHVFNLTA